MSAHRGNKVDQITGTAKTSLYIPWNKNLQIIFGDTYWGKKNNLIWFQLQVKQRRIKWYDSRLFWENRWQEKHVKLIHKNFNKKFKHEDFIYVYIYIFFFKILCLLEKKLVKNIIVLPCCGFILGLKSLGVLKSNFC